MSAESKQKTSYQARRERMNIRERKAAPAPLPNYALSSVCPQCGNDTFKLACKVRCGKCGFMWDCSEL